MRCGAARTEHGLGDGRPPATLTMTGNGINALTAASSFSAICTALVAAPLRRLSLTHQKKQGVGPVQVLADAADEDVVLAGGGGGQGIGQGQGSSTTVTPGALGPERAGLLGRDRPLGLDQDRLAVRYGTGTRTQVGQTSIVASPMILRVSLTIFISSLV